MGQVDEKRLKWRGVRRVDGTGERRWCRQVAVMYCENAQWRKGKRRQNGGRSGEEVLLQMVVKGR